MVRTLPFLLLAALATPPATRVEDVKEALHGVEVADPYRWLEDQNSPETRAWIAAQNAYSRPLLEGIPAHQRIAKRLTELLAVDQTGVPFAAGTRLFFSRRLADQEQSSIWMREGSKDTLLVDPAPLSRDRTASVGILDVSRDGKLLAYGIRRGGEDESVVKLIDVDTRKELPDTLPRGRYHIAIPPDRAGFYYGRFEPQGPRVYYHQLGAAKDSLVFGEGYGPAMSISAGVSDDGRYLLLEVNEGSAADRSEIWVQERASAKPPVAIVKGIDARFQGAIGGNTLFVQTNWQAPNGRILAIDLAHPEREHWREVVPAGETAIESFTPASGRLFVEYVRDVASQITEFSVEGKRVRDLALPDIGTAGYLSGSWADRDIYYRFQSMRTPSTIFRYTPASAKQEIWWQASVPFDRDSLELKQVWYNSKDGTRIPMYLLYRKGMKLDGAAPAFLTGYGGFTVSVTPQFSAAAVLWAESGGVYAAPALRGGGEFGEAWHKAGMREKKQNVFDDFYAAAEWLIANRYTSPARLGISGRSNGGLLVGAALTQRPELFGAVVCGYPLLDMLRYDRFLVALWWVPEYGSASDPAQFKTLYAYSPYHHVKPGVKYPAVLFVTGDGDTRVAPLHARKMAALLQAAGSPRPVLLRYDTQAGHSAGMPVKRLVEDSAAELSFLFWQLQVKP